MTDDIKNKKVSDEKINSFFNLIEEKFTKTSELFPKLPDYIDSIKILKYLDSINFEEQVSMLNSYSGVNKKILKSIIVYNLIKSEDENSNLLNKLYHQISEKYINRRDTIRFDFSEKQEIIDENINLLKQKKAQII